MFSFFKVAASARFGDKIFVIKLSFSTVTSLLVFCLDI
jgi:hypothetical protein